MKNKKSGENRKTREFKVWNKARCFPWLLLIFALSKCASVNPPPPDSYFEQFPEVYQLSARQWKTDLKFINQSLNDSISYYDPFLEKEVKIVYRGGKVVFSNQDESEDKCQADSGRGTEEILKVIRTETRTNIRKVYNKFLRKYPGLEGRITIKIHIDKSGSAAYIFPFEDKTQNPKFTNAIVTEIQKWKFIQSKCEKYDYVTIPFTFSI